MDFFSFLKGLIRRVEIMKMPLMFDLQENVTGGCDRVRNKTAHTSDNFL